MNSRQRVMLALDHQEPDKVPTDLGATTVSSITCLAYNNLRDYLGLQPDTNLRISNRQMGTVNPMEDLLQRNEVDFRPVNMKSPWGFRTKEMSDDGFYDEFGIRWKKALYYYDMVEHHLANCDICDLDKINWPDPHDPGRVTGLKEEVTALYETTD
jgi:uroporphyrinogen decarboxylase